MLRSRFQSLPGAFNASLIPEETDVPRKKGLKATLSRRFTEVNCFTFIIIRVSLASLHWIMLLRQIVAGPI